MEKIIVNELLRILFLLRVGSVFGVLYLFWWAPWPYKAYVMAPFVGGPVVYLVFEAAGRWERWRNELRARRGT